MIALDGVTAHAGDFMLRPPEKKLTHEEMMRQAEEAAARVRPPAPQGTLDAGRPGQEPAPAGASVK